MTKAEAEKYGYIPYYNGKISQWEHGYGWGRWFCPVSGLDKERVKNELYKVNSLCGIHGKIRISRVWVSPERAKELPPVYNLYC